MNRTHLIIDVHNLAHRALHTVGQLTYKGRDTGVLFGIFREVKFLLETYQPAATAFCFDGGRLKRKVVYPEYKQRKGKEPTEEEANGRMSLYAQLGLLREKLLPRLGFRNVFCYEGFEADDLIASVCDGMPKGDVGVIVSTDSDLWQLLVDDRVIIYNPVTKKILTAKLFQKRWGICPVTWANVKALAGCKSDNVEGIQGVGPRRAIKFLSGMMKESEAAFGAIIDGNKTHNRNLELVQLPFAGTPKCKLRRDGFDRVWWDKVMSRFGMVSLVYRRVR